MGKEWTDETTKYFRLTASLQAVPASVGLGELIIEAPGTEFKGWVCSSRVLNLTPSEGKAFVSNGYPEYYWDEES